MYTFIKDLNQHEFNQFASQAQHSHLLQSYQWAEVKNGFKPLFVGVKENEQLVATALILIRSLPLGLKLAYLPRGPLCDMNNLELLRFLTDHLKKLCKQEGCMLIRLDPGIAHRAFYDEEFETAQPTQEGLEAIKNLESLGYIHRGLPYDMHDSFQPRVSAIVSLNEETTKNYSKRLKQSLKYTQKRFTRVHDGRHEYLDELARLIKLTEERQGVHLRNKDYFKLLLDSYPESSGITIASIHPKESISIFESEMNKRREEIELIKDKSPKKVFHLNEQIESLQSLINEIEHIKVQEQVVVGAMLWVTFGQTINLLYAGTDVAYTKFYPQELIYHHLIEQSIDKGLKHMDLGGVQGKLDDGLFTFKSQFRPVVTEYIGEFDYPLSFKSKLFNFAWALRLKLKKRHS